MNNEADGADFAWGPYPPYQTEALACLSGTLVRWALPLDGSNLGEEPGIYAYGYVVSWGDLADPEQLADWTANTNHSPLPGETGFLAAPAGSEPTSFVIDSWESPAINATVTTALQYDDPDLGDTLTYRSAAFYKVVEDPARIDPAGFLVGDEVFPFVTRNGDDLDLSWPPVPGAGSYLVSVWDLATDAGIPCPAAMDCEPPAPGTTHPGGAGDANHYGYRVLAVDPCGEMSSN